MSIRKFYLKLRTNSMCLLISYSKSIIEFQIYVLYKFGFSLIFQEFIS